MIALAIITAIIIYMIGSGFTFGYLNTLYPSSLNIPDPLIVFSCMFWPVALVGLLTFKPFNRIGAILATRQIEQKKIRIEIQKKARIELEQAEGELEELLSYQDDSKRNKARTSVAR